MEGSARMQKPATVMLLYLDGSKPFVQKKYIFFSKQDQQMVE